MSGSTIPTLIAVDDAFSAMARASICHTGPSGLCNKTIGEYEIDGNVRNGKEIIRINSGCNKDEKGKDLPLIIPHVSNIEVLEYDPDTKISSTKVIYSLPGKTRIALKEADKMMDGCQCYQLELADDAIKVREKDGMLNTIMIKLQVYGTSSECVRGEKWVVLYNDGKGNFSTEKPK